MHGEALVFAQVMTVIVLSVAAFVAIALGARLLWRLGSRVTPREATAMNESRLQRLETAVDVIAIEVERIAEAQRFTVALLSERLPGRASELGSPGAVKLVNTPH